MGNPLLEDEIPDDLLTTSKDRNEIETINYLIEKNIGVQRWKFLKENGAIIVKSNTVITNFKDYLDPSKFEQYDIITRKGEYIVFNKKYWFSLFKDLKINNYIQFNKKSEIPDYGNEYIITDSKVFLENNKSLLF